MKQTLVQFLKYALVGLLVNLLGYLFYIALTELGVGPKLAMSLLYVIGVLQTFVLNKQWSFQFNGAGRPALVRYVSVYGLAYCINLLALAGLVDHLGLAHQWVMAGLIVCMPFFLFVGQKFWVFRQASQKIEP